MLSKVTIVGVGLIGGSFGLALKRRKLAQHVIGAAVQKIAVWKCARDGWIKDSL